MDSRRGSPSTLPGPRHSSFAPTVCSVYGRCTCARADSLPWGLSVSRTTVVRVGSEPEQETERNQSTKRSIRSSSQKGRQDTRQSLSEVLNAQDSDGEARTSKASPPPSASVPENNTHGVPQEL
ncbi:hypothetical protein AAFF_G00124410 [Aldrovandia affinis]|uniref:Uncharacterized protein n=1 Tax=Aldrovandia affinis TaxID=143900 RepID=A0AAD7RRH1_9TELE|nr:hypothetical protein AAFF_G00124410 [Aldrovandia affinis]